MRSAIIRFITITAVCFSVAVGRAVDQPTTAHPYEAGKEFSSANRIDELILASLSEKKIKPAMLCSDPVFIRRVYLDVTGTLPETWVVTTFLDNKQPNKRKLLIDKLMNSEEFVDYWTLKWCDLLRVKAEFPINLWPNGVQAYARWIRDAVRDNMRYDQFARELLTSSGSNFRVPQVNFYRAIQSEKPSAITEAVALTFMGTRVDKWSGRKRGKMEAFFSRVAFKGTAEWKEVIVYPDPKPAKPFKAVFPDGKSVRITADQDPREVFADWLITPENEWFARNIVNRAWSWFLARGLIHEPDDIRSKNPPVHPAVLEFLEKELVKADYDLRHIFRLILNSNIYQQSSIPLVEHPDAERLFAHYPVRRLDAEVLLDALCWISGTHETYSSAIPEPFTFIPREHRTVELTDGSITSQFLKMFGRPSRDTGLESERNNEPSDRQRLHLLNSTHIKNKIEKSWRLRNLLKHAKGNDKKVMDSVYLTVLSRFPTGDERTAANEFFQNNQNSRNGTVDMFWALINSKEFLYRH